MERQKKILGKETEEPTLDILGTLWRFPILPYGNRRKDEKEKSI